MGVSAVRPEFGPTLPELAGPRLRALPRAAQAALAVLAALVLLVLLWAVLLRGGDDRTLVVVQDTPTPFNLVYDDALRRVPPAAGQDVALAGEGMRFAVSPLRLAPYRGDSSGTLPVLSSRLQTDMAREYDGFLLRQEGRANINRQQGYELYFQFRRDGETWYGRRVLLLPTTTGREGADILLHARRTPRVPKFSAIGGNGPLKVALRSFRFGTERP